MILPSQVADSARYMRYHGWFDGFVGLWLFSAIIKTMPPLPDNAGYWSRWAYAALHLIAANIPEAAQMIKQAQPVKAKE